ncbi:MAG: 3-deoxy-D-manno-octulosonic acid transferase [bacterium]
MMRLLYDISIQGYRLLILIASLWNRKARAWIEGRRGWRDKLATRLAKAGGDRLWMHCASVGEFEQGRPVLEAIRSARPDMTIVLTFFSPSGYELRKDYPGADIVAYMPLDTPGNAEDFVSIVRPHLAIFIKYEHWYHHLEVLEKRGIPSVLVSAIFRSGQPFFKPWGGFWRRMLKRYALIFVQDQGSRSLLSGIGLEDRVSIAGDTRFDRVCSVAASSGEIKELTFLKDSGPVMVAGSTWPEDERLLSAYISRRPGLRSIIAPHEISENRLSAITEAFPKVLRWSELLLAGPERKEDWQTLLIDNIGLLSRLYRYGTVAYVGGGFHRAGIHNILEAAVYGIPVVFGPVHRKAREAAALKRLGGAFVVSGASDLERILDKLLADAGALAAAGRASVDYVRAEAGATTAVMEGIQGYLRSTS